MALPKLETPTFRGTIPSTGQRFEFRPFLVKEQKILLIALESNDIEQLYLAFRDIINACILSPKNAIDVDKSPSFDIESIFLQISAKSIGEKSKIQITCEHCNEPNEQAINLDLIYVKNFDTSNDNDKQKIALTDEVGVIMKYPSLYEAVKIAQESEKTNQDEATLIYDTIIASISAIYDSESVYPIEDSTKEEVVEFLDSLSLHQLKMIEEFFNKTPYLAYDLQFECSSCGKQNTREIQGMKNFF